MKKSTKHVDDEQPNTVEEHLQMIINDNTYIESKFEKVTSDDLPAWFDEELFIKAQKYYQNNLLGFRTAYFSGLVVVFLIPTISKILSFTNQSSTPCTAFTRYLQTALHLLQLHSQNVKDAGSKFYQSINTIRWKHANASTASKKKHFEGITNRDMVLTQFGFLSYPLLEAQKLSLTNKPEEREAFNHYWRVLGHLLGIPDRINICRKNEHETTLLCEQLRDKLYLKHLENPCNEYFILFDAIIKGWQCIDPLTDKEAFLYIFYQLHGVDYNKPLTSYSKLNVMARIGLFKLIGIPYIGTIVRHITNIIVLITLWLLQRYPVIAWYRYGKHHSKINLYPISNYT